MLFSYDKINWFSEETFKHKTFLSLPAGDGIKSIYFKIKDKVGNEAEPVFDNIILDTEAPYSLSIIINNHKPQNFFITTLNKSFKHF